MEDSKTEEESTQTDSAEQEVRRDIAIPLNRITNFLDQLDIVLTALNDNEWKPHTFYDIRHDISKKQIQIIDKDLQLTIDKLCDDKYVSLIENYDGRSPIQKNNNVPVPDKSYRITYEGRFFLNNVSKKYVDQPYKYSNAIRKRNQIYTNAKIAANIASTLIIIIIGAMGVYVTDKSNKLEQTIEEQRLKTEKQELKIDSLIKLTNDTTRLRKK